VGGAEREPGDIQTKDRFGELEEQLSSQIGGRLRQAREDGGLSQKEFGDAIGYKPAMISAFENGQRRMKLEDLTRACIVLDKPPDFFLGEVPVSTTEPIGLSLRADLPTLPSKELAASVTALLDQIEADLPSGKPIVDLSDLRPEAAAREVLRIAGTEDPPVEMREVCDVIGVPIYKRKLPDSLSAAVMTIGHGTFAIGVNEGHGDRRRRFSVAHELGHAVLRHEASYYLEYAVEDAWEPPNYSYFVEREANAFAAALLMDERWVREDFAAGMREVGKLADRYGVSSEAMGFRLANIGLV
jgi:Zn-dependent peptidase ImmA (M78 family)/DNA-binding XRE family transcriptional regulator